MFEAKDDLMPVERRSDWVRLRTLVAVRWIAIFGQIASILVAIFFFNLHLEIGFFAIVIGASVILNIVATFIYPENTRLSERGATLMLLFDITQLSCLLYFSGGLTNPFSVLILAPVSISASALRPKSSIVNGAFAIAFVTLLTVYHVPLHMSDGVELIIPDIFLFGNWASIVIGILFLGCFPGV